MVMVRRGTEANTGVSSLIGKTIDSAFFRRRSDERFIFSRGPKAIGDYGERVTKRFLVAQGITPRKSFPYFNRAGLLHTADSYDPKARTIFEVKTGRFRLGSYQEFRIE